MSKTEQNPSKTDPIIQASQENNSENTINPTSPGNLDKQSIDVKRDNLLARRRTNLLIGNSIYIIGLSIIMTGFLTFGLGIFMIPVALLSIIAAVMIKKVIESRGEIIERDLQQLEELYQEKSADERTKVEQESKTKVEAEAKAKEMETERVSKLIFEPKTFSTRPIEKVEEQINISNEKISKLEGIRKKLREIKKSNQLKRIAELEQIAELKLEIEAILEDNNYEFKFLWDIDTRSDIYKLYKLKQDYFNPIQKKLQTPGQNLTEKDLDDGEILTRELGFYEHYSHPRYRVEHATTPEARLESEKILIEAVNGFIEHKERSIIESIRSDILEILEYEKGRLNRLKKELDEKNGSALPVQSQSVPSVKNDLSSGPSK